eukprot:scaffold25539_cov225-Cylindrotheca_fusiformis.AAC.1
MKQDLLRGNYTTKKRDPLLPSDVLDMNLHVQTCRFDLRQLMHYTAVLNSLDTAMRFEGISTVTFDSFNDVSMFWRTDDLGR